MFIKIIAVLAIKLKNELITVTGTFIMSMIL